MKKKILTLMLVTLTSLSALTGCKSDKEPAQAPTATQGDTKGGTKETKAERPEDAPSQETMEAIPEGTALMAPPVDADGNLPEGFDADEYYAGYAAEDDTKDGETQENKDKTEKEDKE